MNALCRTGGPSFSLLAEDFFVLCTTISLFVQNPAHCQEALLLSHLNIEPSSSDVWQSQGAFVCWMMTVEAFLWHAFQIACWV